MTEFHPVLESQASLSNSFALSLTTTSIPSNHCSTCTAPVCKDADGSVLGPFTAELLEEEKVTFPPPMKRAIAMTGSRRSARPDIP